MKHALPLLAALALGACATLPGGLVRGDGFARLGQPTRVGVLVATPQVLVEDSRCPVNVQCIWAGRVVVTTRIDGPGWRESVNLTLGKPYATHGTGITLASVQPQKTSGTRPAPNDYLFGFEPR